jgi:hypothetical protein
MSRDVHDRTALHEGVDLDLVILLAEAIGVHPVGADLHTVLAALDNRLSQLELTETHSGLFTIEAIQRRVGAASFTESAIVQRSQAAAFVADAYLAGSFNANAVILRTASVSFTADAVIAGAGGGPDAFQGDAFQNDAFD